MRCACFIYFKLLSFLTSFMVTCVCLHLRFSSLVYFTVSVSFSNSTIDQSIWIFSSQLYFSIDMAYNSHALDYYCTENVCHVLMHDAKLSLHDHRIKTIHNRKLCLILDIISYFSSHFRICGIKYSTMYMFVCNLCVRMSVFGLLLYFYFIYFFYFFASIGNMLNHSHRFQVHRMNQNETTQLGFICSLSRCAGTKDLSKLNGFIV